jgi:endonuclease YncB( thermonuclease family)
VRGLSGRGSIVLTKSLAVRLFLVITDSVPCQVLAGDFTGQVAAIVDGDTIEVLRNQHPQRIRLNGIDCNDWPA